MSVALHTCHSPTQEKRSILFVTDRTNRFWWTHTCLLSSSNYYFPNYYKDFILCSNAAGHGIGAVLMQKDSHVKHRVVEYVSCFLNKVEQNYGVTNRESLSVVWALRHFPELILGYYIHICSDHNAVTEIFKGTNFTGKFACWQLCSGIEAYHLLLTKTKQL